MTDRKYTKIVTMVNFKGLKYHIPLFYLHIFPITYIYIQKYIQKLNIYIYLIPKIRKKGNILPSSSKNLSQKTYAAGPLRDEDSCHSVKALSQLAGVTEVGTSLGRWHLLGTEWAPAV